jgi:hypothetical protein
MPERPAEPYPQVRAKYNEFARKLEKGDPSFLKFLDSKFIYIDPKGRRMDAEQWSKGMRDACRNNKNGRVRFRITEIRKKPGRLLVSYVWSYRYRRRSNSMPTLTETISTDTWKIVGNDIKMIVSKDFRFWNRKDERPNPEDL